jgi:hypothetical protein
VIALFRKLNPKYQESKNFEDEQAKPYYQLFSREAKLQAIKYIKHIWTLRNDDTLCNKTSASEGSRRRYNMTGEQ